MPDKTVPETTRALVAPAVNTALQLTTLSLPQQLQPHEALVRISAVAICHAELAVLSGKIPSPFPRVLGHEGAGVIVALGSALNGDASSGAEFQVGTKVLLSFASCGECNNCSTDHPVYCAKTGELVWSGEGTSPFLSREEGHEGKLVKGGFFGQSSFAQYAVVHASCMVAVPDVEESEMGLLAPLGCAVQTGVGTIMNVLDVKEEMSVAVFGVGAVGMCAIMGAKLRKAGVVIAVDLNEERLNLARELGATHTVISDKDSTITADRIRKICQEATGDASGVQRAMDATGVPAVVEAMVAALGVRGQAAIVGAAAPGQTAAIEAFDFLQSGKSLVGMIEGDCIPRKVRPALLSTDIADTDI